MIRNQALLSMLAAALIMAACNNDIGTQGPRPGPNPRIELRILETTDIHVHLADYDYYRAAPSITVGLARTASLIDAARQEADNAVLVDNGDLIQGNPLGDYMARDRGLEPGEVHPVYKAMNLLDYDVGNIGNHEFNYGLDFLDVTLQGANFPYVSANVFRDDGDDDDSNDEPYFTPYVIKDKVFTDTAGESHTLKVGYIGFVPPQIMIWDRTNLAGEVIAKDMVEMARKYVPEMKAAGADLVIAIPHSGLTASSPQGLDENATYYLATVPGIDAIAFGHSHRVFPGDGYADMPEVDTGKGTVYGVPAVMAGAWGSHLGVIDLTLERIGRTWTVVDSSSQARPISERVDGETVALVDADTAILDAISEEHNATVAWMNEPLGMTSTPINSFFARVQDDPSVQIVTAAQRAYVEQLIQGTELDGLPVLSAGAPFKAGFGGPDNYTDVPAGVISMRHVAELYVYPNTLQVVRITGSDVREWLERAAGAFNQIDPALATEQALLDDSFPSYNFDVIDGVTYEIDITEPSRYDVNGELLDAGAHRIKNLMYQGAPIDDAQAFLVATNNYRASGGGNFPGITPHKVVIASPDENRQVLASYIAAQGTVNPGADGNWRIADINATVNVRFATSPSERAAMYAQNYPRLVNTGQVDAEGYAIYQLDLSPAQ